MSGSCTVASDARGPHRATARHPRPGAARRRPRPATRAAPANRSAPRTRRRAARTSGTRGRESTIDCTTKNTIESASTRPGQCEAARRRPRWRSPPTPTGSARSGTRPAARPAPSTAAAAIPSNAVVIAGSTRSPASSGRVTEDAAPVQCTSTSTGTKSARHHDAHDEGERRPAPRAQRRAARSSAPARPRRSDPPARDRAVRTTTTDERDRRRARGSATSRRRGRTATTREDRPRQRVVVEELHRAELARASTGTRAARPPTSRRVHCGSTTVRNTRRGPRPSARALSSSERGSETSRAATGR